MILGFSGEDVMRDGVLTLPLKETGMPYQADVYDVHFDNGRYVRTDHLFEIGDKVPLSKPFKPTVPTTPQIDPWLMGLLICNGNAEGDVATDKPEVVECLRAVCGSVEQKSRHRGIKGVYYRIPAISVEDMFGSQFKKDWHLPPDFLNWSTLDRKALFQGMRDADMKDNQFGLTTKILALEQMYLAESLNFPARLYRVKYGPSFRFFVQLTAEPRGDVATVLSVKYVGKENVYKSSDDVSGLEFKRC